MPHTSGCCSQETCRNVWVISVTTRICASWTSSDFATAQLLELFELLEGRSVGPDIGLRKGKTVRRQGENIRVNISTAPPPHHTPPHPTHVMERYGEVTLGGDIMKVNGTPFFVSISSALKFGTIALLLNQKMPTVLASIKQIHQLYRMRGFRVKMLHYKK